MYRFKFAQNFSIGFKSGEYAGKKMIATPCSFAVSRKLGSLWKLALSSTTTSPTLKDGRSSSWNQPLNR